MNQNRSTAAAQLGPIQGSTLIGGPAAAGNASQFARADHVHAYGNGAVSLTARIDAMEEEIKRLQQRVLDLEFENEVLIGRND